MVDFFMVHAELHSNLSGPIAIPGWLPQTYGLSRVFVSHFERAMNRVSQEASAGATQQLKLPNLRYQNHATASNQATNTATKQRHHSHHSQPRLPLLPGMIHPVDVVKSRIQALPTSSSPKDREGSSNITQARSIYAVPTQLTAHLPKS